VLRFFQFGKELGQEVGRQRGVERVEDGGQWGGLVFDDGVLAHHRSDGFER
jgi:hypothetical protein